MRTQVVFPTATGINFRSSHGKKDRWQSVSSSGVFFRTRNPTHLATLINGALAVYAGGLRPDLAPGRINLNDIVNQHGSLQNYMIAHRMIAEGETPKVVAVFFAGGMAPSANAVFRGILAAAFHRGYHVLAFEDGCDGFLNGNAVFLNTSNTYGIQRDGGVIIGSARTNPGPAERQIMKENLQRWGISKVIAIGGDDTQTTAKHLSEEAGIDVVGVPKTVDNDVPGTDATFGHESVITSSAKEMAGFSSSGVISNTWWLFQVMGRKSGSWTLRAGLAAGVTRTIIGEEYSKAGILQLIKASRREKILLKVLSDIMEVVRINGQKAANIKNLRLLVTSCENDKEITIDIDALAQQIAWLVERRKANGHKHGTLAFAEALIERLQIEVTERDSNGRPVKGLLVQIGQEIEYDSHGNPRLSDIDLAAVLAGKIKKITGKAIKSFLVGYQHRTTDPVASDINLSTRFGRVAMALIAKGRCGRMVRIRHDKVGSIPFSRLPV
ncbi:MAG: 6-phosphofructokinase, partial [Candidatus Margulisiibacteriota bacterium]